MNLPDSIHPDGPSLRSELRRGFNAYNLAVAAVTALLFSAGVFVVSGAQAAGVAGIALFIGITALHAAMHAYFGWRLQRGMRALAEGRKEEGLRLLRILDRAGIEHYDPDRLARRALAAARVESTANI